MITAVFGVLCAACLFLTIWDRAARPWAAVIVSGWAIGTALYYLVGEQAFDLFPAISGLVCIATLGLMLSSHTKWKAAVHAIAVIMLCLDGWLFWSDSGGVYVGVEYATLASAGLLAQLAIISHRGALNAWTGLLSWRGAGLRRVFNMGHPRGSDEEAA